ncbi:hypothetical protein EG329_006999 [Mollisiaceae sp. DMI_Dod_QoI]|nr:hypothetical protein EG329_006999 [Helotiales sp. DMI_Dod_QoI]
MMENRENSTFGRSAPIQVPADESVSGWQFLLDPTAPNWPSQALDSGQLPSAARDTFSSDADEPIWDHDLWENWDSHANVSYDAENTTAFYPSDNTLATISEEQFFSPISQISSDPGTGSYLSSPSNNDYFASSSAYSSSGNTKSYSSSGAVSTAFSSPRDSVQNSGSSQASNSTRQSRQNSMYTSTRAKSETSKLTTAPSTTKRGSGRMHNNVERQYRARLNNEFSMLLNALPKELTSSSGADDRKELSKIEILDLAKRHISALEREDAQLKEEKVMLKGQIQLLKRLVDALR